MNPYRAEIMILANDPACLSFVLNHLGKRGYRVDGANGYLQALKKIERSEYDLVVFFNEIKKRDMDYVENFAPEIRPGIRFMDYSGPVHQLPDLIDRLMQEKH